MSVAQSENLWIFVLFIAICICYEIIDLMLDYSKQNKNCFLCRAAV